MVRGALFLARLSDHGIDSCPQIVHHAGIFLMGCCAVYFFLNLLSQQKSIGIFSVISIMGYGLLPIVVLAAIAITISLKYVCTLSQLVPHSRSWFDFVGCAPQGLLWTSSRVRGGRLGHSHRRPLL